MLIHLRIDVKRTEKYINLTHWMSLAVRWPVWLKIWGPDCGEAYHVTDTKNFLQLQLDFFKVKSKFNKKCFCKGNLMTQNENNVVIIPLGLPCWRISDSNGAGTVGTHSCWRSAAVKLPSCSHEACGNAAQWPAPHHVSGGDLRVVYSG